ncbi:hypothetical protein H0H92_008629 [Tricholoma furcatifolium]|nr:hypothetical protein H0H92_008629 [Tricholoma furcatifolium]
MAQLLLEDPLQGTRKVQLVSQPATNAPSPSVSYRYRSQSDNWSRSPATGYDRAHENSHHRSQTANWRHKTRLPSFRWFSPKKDTPRHASAGDARQSNSRFPSFNSHNVDSYDAAPTDTAPGAGRKDFTSHFPNLSREAYHNLLLLRLPSVYFNRVASVFEDLDINMSELVGMSFDGMIPATPREGEPRNPASANLKVTWEDLIDSLLREWKTLNIISALLLSAILTLLQIDGAASDPITRNCSLIALVCALMSLLYGCLYIIRFAPMRKTYTALKWAQMAEQTKTLGWWDIWVLLAMPAVWLAWSMILFIVCIMAFSWRSGTDGLEVTSSLSAHAELALRITISFVLALGVVFFVLIMNTLRHYGRSTRKQFRMDLERSVPNMKGRGRSKHTMPDHVIDLGPPASIPDSRIPYHLATRGLTAADWVAFITDVPHVWACAVAPSDDGSRKPKHQEVIMQLLDKWNVKFFQPLSTRALLCHEYLAFPAPSPLLAIYIVDMTPVVEGVPVSVQERLASAFDMSNRRVVLPFEPGESMEHSSMAIHSTTTDGTPHISTGEEKLGSRTPTLANHSHRAGYSVPSSSSRIDQHKRPSPVPAS